MITDILTLTPEFGFEETIEFKTLIDESETGHEVRDALIDAGLRQFKLSLKFRSEDSIKTIWDFYIARQGRKDDFLIKVLTDFSTTDEPIGVGDGTTTQFLLHNFPVDTTANHSAKLSGVLTSAYVLSNDTANEKSYITFTTAPTLGAVITISYEFYMRVRFKDDQLTRQLVNYKLLHMGIDLVEVRWNTYFPMSGNSSSSSSSSSQTGISTRWYTVSDHLATSGETGYNNWDGNSLIYQRSLPRMFVVPKVTTNFNFTRMCVYLNNAPGGSAKRVFTLYHNDQPTPLQLTIAGSSKYGIAYADVKCENGDHVYIREDMHNGPASSHICMGTAVRTGDPYRCPVIGPSHNNSWAPLTDNANYGQAGLFSSYNGDSLAFHTLITTPGTFYNMQVKNPYLYYSPQIWGTVNTPTIDLTLIKKVGSDKFFSMGFAAHINDGEFRGEDVTHNAHVDAGDVVGWQGSAFFSGVPKSMSIDFIPDNPRQCNHGKSFTGAPFTTVDYFDPIHGTGAWQQLSLRAEPFTMFAVAGKIKNLTILCMGASFTATNPGIIVLRKNGVDTSLVFTLTNTVTTIIVPGCLSVDIGDRLSFKAKGKVNDHTCTSMNIGWTFEAENSGEWPLFNTYSIG
jgi:uncharacterized protein (TIGR02217 family)